MTHNTTEMPIRFRIDDPTRPRILPRLLVPRIDSWILALQNGELERLDLARQAGFVIPPDIV
jgi:hypothetical protein